MTGLNYTFKCKLMTRERNTKKEWHIELLKTDKSDIITHVDFYKISKSGFARVYSLIKKKYNQKLILHDQTIFAVPTVSSSNYFELHLKFSIIHKNIKVRGGKVNIYDDDDDDKDLVWKIFGIILIIFLILIFLCYCHACCNIIRGS